MVDPQAHKPSPDLLSLRPEMMPSQTVPATLLHVPDPHPMLGTLAALWHTVATAAQRVALRRQQYTAVQEAVAALNRSQADCAILDVGGAPFHTARAVLRQRGGADYFDALFSPEFGNGRQADDGVFIDRDPECFALLLQYLREGAMHLPLGLRLLRRLRREAQQLRLREFHERSAAQPYCVIVPTDPAEGLHVYGPNTYGWRRLPHPKGLGPPDGVCGACARAHASAAECGAVFLHQHSTSSTRCTARRTHAIPPRPLVSRIPGTLCGGASGAVFVTINRESSRGVSGG